MFTNDMVKILRYTVFILSFVLFNVSLNAKSAKTAKLYLKNTVYDLGVTKKSVNPVRTLQIEFQNKGNAKLVIADVSSTCLCVKVDYPKDFVPAKGKAVLNVTMDLSKMLPKDYVNTITVQSNSAGGPVTIQLKTKIEY